MKRGNKNEIKVEEEQWIWGNTRGGGGAPLKNMNGELITNLKTVINGKKFLEILNSFFNVF